LSLGNQLQASNLRVQKLRSGSNIIYIALNSGDIIATKKFLVNNQSPITCSNQSLSSCFKYSMSVRDVTSGKSDVNNATVSSGDILAYTLLADNMSRNEISDFKLSINFDNALAYSKLKNSYGGAVNNGIVSYFISSIAPNQTQTEEITTIVKSPLPSNSISTSDGNYFNQKMITSFGNTVVVSVPKNFNKFYEININDSLPSSNYLTSLIILVGIILVLIYFVLRTSLIRQEIKIIKHTHSNYTARPKK
jgi:hypothetical protein